MTTPSRPRIEAPTWMGAWPRGLRPHALHATRQGVELLYRLPQRRWVCVAIQLQGGRAQVWTLPSHHDDARAQAQLCRALTQQLAQSPGAVAWLRAVGEAVAELEAGGTEPDRLASEAAAPVRVARALAGDAGGDGLERALAEWARSGAGIEARGDLPAALLTAVMLALTGDREGAWAASERASAAAVDFVDERICGELCEQLGRTRRALDHFEVVALASERFDDHRRVADMAARIGEQARARAAAMTMAALAEDDDQRREAIEQMIAAGGFSEAEAMLAARLEADGRDDWAGLRLATLQLWRGQIQEAAAGARALLAAGHDRLEIHRTLGAAELLAGRPRQALAALGVAMARTLPHSWGEGPDEETALWYADARLQLGQLEAAQDSVLACHFGDHPVWQLLRAAILERRSPQIEIGGEAWFIVDSLLAELLGDRWQPGVGGPSHEQALAGIELALGRFAGNRGRRLTVLEAGEDGPRLRWIDELQSVRRRAEQLQKRLFELGPARLLQEFAALEARHPQVPFNVTYAAELLLWVGDYEQALARFEDAWARTRTRWGYVGVGACLLMLGRFDEALAAWEAGLAHYRYLDAEATYAYRGELHRLRGQLEAARADLEHAVRYRPTRLGAWIELALTCLAAGDEARGREAAATARALAPAMFWLARRSAAVAMTEDPDAPLEPVALTRILERWRGMLRGNRSSVTYTLIDDDGRMRIFPSDARERWTGFGRRLRDPAAGWLQTLTIPSRDQSA